MDISLIICAYNEEAEIAACLDAAIRHAGGRFREIIVVDNASTDRTADIARGFPGVTVVREERKGLTNARMCGFEHAKGEWLAYIDADSHLSESWFETLERAAARHPEAVSISGPRYYFGTAWHRRMILNGFWWLTAPLTHAIVGYMLLGGNFVARRSALEAIGGFDRSIAFYGEDTDLARRLSAVGRPYFTMRLHVFASARRFDTEGLFMPNIRYALNYLWPVLFGRPYTVRYNDVR